MGEAKPTPGPWYADKHGRIWRRPPSDLYENGGGVAGDKPLATVNKGWFGEGEEGYPVDANASLIAEAGTVFHTTGLTPSQLVERVKELEGALRKISAIEDQMYGPDWEEIEEARGIADAALSKARPNTAEGEPEAEATDGTRWNQTPCEHCGHTEGEHFNARCLHITGETRYTPAAAKEPSP